MCGVAESAQQVQCGVGAPVAVEGGTEQPADRVPRGAAENAGLEVVLAGGFTWLLVMLV